MEYKNISNISETTILDYPPMILTKDKNFTKVIKQGNYKAGMVMLLPDDAVLVKWCPEKEDVLKRLKLL